MSNDIEEGELNSDSDVEADSKFKTNNKIVSDNENETVEDAVTNNPYDEEDVSILKLFLVCQE